MVMRCRRTSSGPRSTSRCDNYCALALLLLLSPVFVFVLFSFSFVWVTPIAGASSQCERWVGTVDSMDGIHTTRHPRLREKRRCYWHIRKNPLFYVNKYKWACSLARCIKNQRKGHRNLIISFGFGDSELTQLEKICAGVLG